MENIKKNACMNFAAGYTKLMIAPVEEIKSVDLIDVNTKKVTLNTGGRFAEIEAENIQYGSQNTDGVYECGIQCNLHGNNPDLASTFEVMTKKRFIVSIYDKNGVWWIQGDTNEPLRFEYSQLSEPKAPGFSGYKLKFIRKTTLPLCRLYV